MNAKSYLNQSYQNLKEQCKRNGVLFVDQMFQANESSLRINKENSNESSSRKSEQIFWKRPNQIANNPRFIVNGIEPNDLVQGSLGDCWFISSLATLASIPKYCKWVIPEGQNFDRDYAGIFHFRFWKLGSWIDVVVDDFLPVDENNELLFCHNETDKNEFFGPLIEKAYAKIFGSYGQLDGGFASTAMTDLTGAVCEMFDIRKCVGNYVEDDEDEGDDEEDDNDNNDENNVISTDLESLWIFIVKSYKMKSLMNVSLRKNDSLDEDGTLPNGLISLHAYSILQAVELRLKKEKSKSKIRLLKFRNPHGQEKPWKGAWSIDSKKWKNLDDAIKNRYKLNLNPQGEFFMSFKDFTTYFDDLEVAHLDLNAFYDDSEEIFDETSKWKLKQFNNSCKNYNNSVWSNSQYFIEIKETTFNYQSDDEKDDEDDDDEEDDDGEDGDEKLVSVIVSLSQINYDSINLNLYSADLDEKKIKSNLFNKRKFNPNELSLVESTNSCEYRDVTKRFYLPPGYYIIIPSTEENNNIDYCLRIFTVQKTCDSIIELN